jgi:hypothetical protein
LKHKEILSFIVSCYEDKTGNLRSIKIDNLKYILITNQFIIDQCIFLNLSISTVSPCVKKLEDFGFINVVTFSKYLRYITLEPNFYELWPTENWRITPSYYLKNYYPSQWQSIQSEYKNKLGAEFNKQIECINDSVGIKGIKYNEKYALYNYFKKSLENQVEKLKPKGHRGENTFA